MVKNNFQYIKDYLEDLPDLEVQITRLEQLLTANKMNVVAFGKYNHGKSTLLNALTSTELFKTGDIRTTVEIQEVTYNDIVWCDTPGLDADIKRQDDRKSIDAVNKADLILIVHNAQEGELDNNEFKFIRSKINEDWFNTEKLILVISQTDQVESKEDIIQIKAKIKKQLSTLKSPIKIIDTSASLHIKGMRQNKQALKKKGNINKLLNLIAERQHMIKDFQKKEFQKIKALILFNLNTRIKDIKTEVNALEIQKESGIMNKFRQDYDKTINHIKNEQNLLKNL